MLHCIDNSINFIKLMNASLAGKHLKVVVTDLRWKVRIGHPQRVTVS